MTSALSMSLVAKAAAKLALSLLRKWAAKHGPKLAEWRGTLLCERESGKLWRVSQNPEDPCRLFVPAIGLEYAWPPGGWSSDGPSIPATVCKLLQCSRESFLKSGFLHDFIYQNAAVYARFPDGLWSRIPVAKRDADVLLRAALSAEGASEGQAAAIYAGVRTPFAAAAWRHWRNQSKNHKKSEP